MFRKTNKTTINKIKTINSYTSFRFSFIFKYFKYSLFKIYLLTIQWLKKTIMSYLHLLFYIITGLI